MKKQKQKGAAILGAMVTVTLVASVAGAAVHQMWKATEVEAAERTRQQAQWLLRGALDWSRLLLRQDAMSSAGADHLSEPWAIPLQETKLSAFIEAHAGISNASANASDAFISGFIEDDQAKLNLKNMVLDNTGKHAAHVQRLFERLGLEKSEFEKLQTGLLKARSGEANSALMPQTMADLKWLGLGDKTIEALKPHATLLDRLVRLNANTASATAIWAVAEGLTFAEVQAIVQARQSQHFASIKDLAAQVPDKFVNASYLDVRSNSYRAQGYIRMDGLELGLQSGLSRTGHSVGIESVNTSALQVR